METNKDCSVRLQDGTCGDGMCLAERNRQCCKLCDRSKNCPHKCDYAATLGFELRAISPQAIKPIVVNATNSFCLLCSTRGCESANDQINCKCTLGKGIVIGYVKRTVALKDRKIVAWLEG
jgi:hypothetical protein